MYIWIATPRINCQQVSQAKCFRCTSSTFWISWWQNINSRLETWTNLRRKTQIWSCAYLHVINIISKITLDYTTARRCFLRTLQNARKCMITTSRPTLSAGESQSCRAVEQGCSTKKHCDIPQQGLHKNRAMQWPFIYTVYIYIDINLNVYWHILLFDW